METSRKHKELAHLYSRKTDGAFFRKTLDEYLKELKNNWLALEAQDTEIVYSTFTSAIVNLETSSFKFINKDKKKLLLL